MSALDMYFTGMSHHKAARHMGYHYNLETTPVTVYRWVQDYNYFRPHMGFGNKTPAVTAGADTSFGSWVDIATLEDANV